MALRNAVKVALVSESEEPLSRPGLDDRFVPRFAEHIAAPVPAAVAATAADAEPLADALLWWVKEQLWLSEEPPAAANEPVLPFETPAPLEPEVMDAQTAADASARIETPARTEELTPMEPPPAPAIVVEPAADAPLQPESVIKPESVINETPREEEKPAAPWRERAAATRAMAAILPASSTSLMIAKIAALYDELAEEPVDEVEMAPVDPPRPPLPSDRYRAARR